jgi:8-oxo-dGTP diphosphatase
VIPPKTRVRRRPADTKTFTASLPGKRAAAWVLFTDGCGRILLVEPTYKLYWDLPGGVVNGDESPRDAAVREVREELGLDVSVGRLLVVDWFPPRPSATEALMFVFAGGVLTDTDTARIALQTDELRSWGWTSPPDADVRLAHAPILHRRIAAAFLAIRHSDTRYLEDGCER